MRTLKSELTLALVWLLLVVVTVGIILLSGGCACPTGADEEEDAGVIADPTFQQEPLTGPVQYKKQNSWLNDQWVPLTSAIRMNACVRAWVRTYPSQVFQCDYNSGRAACTGSGGNVFYIFDCRPDGGGVERCELGNGIATAGYCLWAPSGTTWWSQHYIAGNSILLGSEPGYTNKWTNP
jgi:hypothetical protein